jgi:type II secretory pathway component GspD/PulD (secretin)
MSMNTRRDRCGWLVVSAALGFCLLGPAAPATAQDKDKPPPAGTREKPVTEVIPLSAPDAEQVTASLRAMFPNPKTGGPFIEYFPHRAALLVRGSAEQVREVKEVLRVLGEETPGGGNTRVITLDKGSAATLARAIKQMITELRGNPVKIVMPAGQGDELPKPEPPKKQDKGVFDSKQGKGRPVVILVPLADRLIVTTEDPEAMRLVLELVRLCLQPAPLCDFVVIRLKHHDAGQLAHVIDTAFNGSRPGKEGAQADDRVRVLADPAINALLLRASQLDLLTIRDLVAQMDVPEAKGPNEPPEGKKGFKKGPPREGKRP